MNSTLWAFLLMNCIGWSFFRLVNMPRKTKKGRSRQGAILPAKTVQKKKVPICTEAALVCSLRIAREDLARSLGKSDKQTFKDPEVHTALEAYIAALTARLHALKIAPVNDRSYMAAKASLGWKVRTMPFISEKYID